MSFLKLLLPALICTIVFAGCTSNYGKKYKLDDRHTVFYKGEGLEETHAKKLADYLKAQNYFLDTISSSVQLTKNKDTFNINFVVNETKLIEGYELKFLLFGGFISEMVFDKAPVTIQLTNNRLVPFKNLGYASPISAEKTE
ncbi:MAG: hypothetical protein WBP16_02310 [Ferruginibacter sp.]